MIRHALTRPRLRWLLLLSTLCICLLPAGRAHAQNTNLGVPQSPLLQRLEQWAQADPAQAATRRQQIKSLTRFLKGKDVRQSIAENLLLFKEGRITEAMFFKRLALAGGRMTDVIAVRKAIDNTGGSTLRSYFMGTLYSEGGSVVEQKLLLWRYHQTMNILHRALAKFKGRRLPFSIYYAPIGSWPQQIASGGRSLTFPGDIDFSFLCADSKVSWELKQAFDAELKAYFNDLCGRPVDFGPIAFDTVATAHGRATLDVYVGAHGRKYGDLQMLKATVQEIDLTKGAIKPDKIPGSQAVAEVAAEDTLYRLKDLDTGTFKQHTEPGLSMEMARHLLHDIIKPNLFGPLDSLVKGAKYLDRSNEALKGDLGLAPSNQRLADFAGQLIKNKGNPKTQMEIIYGFFGRKDLLGTKLDPGATGANRIQVYFNEAVVKKFWDQCQRAIWDNATKGFEFKLKTLGDQVKSLDRLPPSSKETQAKEIYAQYRHLLEMVKIEFEVFKASGMAGEIPSGIKTLTKNLEVSFKEFKTKFAPIILGPEGMKDLEFVRELAGTGKTSAVRMAAAFVARKTMQLLETGMDGAMRVNAMLDLMDDTLLGELRGEKDFSEFLAMARSRAMADIDPTKPLGAKAGFLSRLRLKAGRTVAKIELKLNNMLLNNCISRGLRGVNIKANKIIQATAAGRGAVKAMMVFNLYNELNAYRDAWVKGGWNALATEFFRRRVPFGSSLEHAIMGNVGLALWDAVTTLLPPLAMGQAAVSLMGEALNWSEKLYYSSELTLFIDNLYADAVFKLTKVEKLEDFKLGVWRLVKIKYNGTEVDLQAFLKKSREQIKEMQKALETGVTKRVMPLSTWGITGDWEERWLLKKNLAKTDPMLVMLDEMMKNPVVGPKLKSHYLDVYETRWQRVKLGFILKTISYLEDRRAAEQALYAGFIPGMYAKLLEIAKKLEIADQVSKNLDDEVGTSYLTRLFEWLKDMKREYYSQGSIEDSYERAARLVKRYLEVYSEILKARKRAEEVFALGQPVDQGLRILTSPLFLEGKADRDASGFVKWASLPGRKWGEVKDELVAIKKKCLPKGDGKLDNAFDKELFEKILYHTVWAKLWKHVFVEASGRITAITSQSWVLSGRLGAALSSPDALRDKAHKRFMYHMEERKKLLARFQKNYCGKAGLTILLRQLVDGKRTDQPITGATVKATDPQGTEHVLSEREAGSYVLVQVEVGSYRVSAQAKGYLTENGKDTARKTVSIPADPADPAGKRPKPTEATIYLVPQEKPKLKLEFKKATASEPPRLLLTISSQQVELDAKTLTASLEGAPLKLTVSGGGKTVGAEHRFTAPVSPGKHTVKVSIRDQKQTEYKLDGNFTFVPALVMTGQVLDDKGGAPQNGKANSGETVKIAFKLKNLDPWPYQGLVITCPTGDARLKPTGKAEWHPALLPSRQEVVTTALPFAVGEVKKPDKVVLPLKTSLKGQTLDTGWELAVTVYPALALEVELVPPVDDAKRTGTPNNGDGKANQGESITLTLRVKNSGQEKSPAYRLRLASSSPHLVLGRVGFNGTPLGAGASQDFRLPATVGTTFKKALTVKIKVELLPQGQTKGRSFELPLQLSLAPLDIKLLGIKVQDPKSGSLLKRNDGNGRLGSGEYGYLTLRLVNNGSDIQQAFIDLKGPRVGGLTIHKPQAGSVSMPRGRPVEARFEIDMPVDYQKNSITLTVRVKDGLSGRWWEGTHTLPVDVKSDFSSKLTLMGAAGPAKPEEIKPGATLPYELEIKNLSRQDQQGLSLGLEYTAVRIVPNLWTGTDFPAGGSKVFKGTISIPADIKGDSFWVRLSLRNAAGTSYLHKNRFEFKLGVRPTTVKLSATPPPQGSQAWKITVKVTTKDKQPVDQGVVLVKAGDGSLSADRLPLSGGRAQFIWTPPVGFRGRTRIEANYTGDQEDPAQPDRKYQSSSASIQLPPEAAATRVVVKATPPPRPGGPYGITVKVLDQKTGRAVNQGVLEITCDLGKLSGGGIGAQGGVIKLGGKAIVLSWRGPPDPRAKGQAVFSYSGDQQDPALPDQRYQPSRAVLKLPPKALITPNLAVVPGLVDKDKRIWRLDVTLTDERRRPISPAKLIFKADGGSFAGKSSVLEVEKVIQGGKYGKGWRETDDQQHTITVTYPGDQKGPGGENQRYDSAQVTLTLPPQMIARSTVFVVDASGSMAGGKLASAKAAVRAALSGYDPNQGQEEWALMVFAGCGNIRLYQPFTTNPADITSKLTFRASGGTPIAASLRRAAAYLRRAARGKEGRIILLSDGGESCRGKPVEAAKSIRRSVRHINLGGRP